MEDTTPITDNRAERVLAYMVAGVIAVSILAFLAVIIGTAAGAGADDGFSHGIWPFVIMLPWFGLPLGFVLIMILLIVNMTRRRREAKGSRRGR